MKNELVKGLLMGVFIMAPLAHSANTTTEKVKNLMSQEQTIQSNKAVKAIEKEQNSLLETVNQGVAEGYKKVLKASQLLLQDGKEKQAISLLREATGSFDIAMAANPELKLIPIDGDVAISALVTTPELIKKETKVAIDLLKNNKVQAAQAVLEPMKDEMVVVNVYLPMVTYPDAIKLATKYLVDGKKENAMMTLDATLSTIVVEKVVIPLAIIRTESLLKGAAELDKKDKTKAHELLNAAQEQLEIATLLGYTDQNSKAYENLNTQIKAIHKEIDGRNVVEKMYDKLKASVSSLISKEKTEKSQ